MNENELDYITEQSIELRRGIMSEIIKFKNTNPTINKKDIFTIFSMAMSSIMAETTYLLFKKDIGLEQPRKYIDSLSHIAKNMLTSFSELSSKEIQ